MNGSGITRALSGLDLNRLKALRKEAIWLAILIALSLAFHRLVYQGGMRAMKVAESEISVTRTEIERLSSEILAAENLRKTVAEAAKNLKTSSERLGRMKERLPSDKNLSTILAEISGQDPSGGVRIVSIKPMQVEDKGELIKLPFQITLESRFYPFGDYLERIENLKRVMIVENFLIESKEEAPGSLSSQLYLSAYILAR